MRPVFRVLITGVAIGAVATLAACSPPAAESGPSDLVIGVETRLITVPVNPLDGAQVVHLNWQGIYETLIQWDMESSGFGPSLAEDFELSDDRRSMTMTLRDDVDFTDGTHLTADVLSEYFDVLLESDGAAGKGVLESADFALTVTGEYDLEITTTSAMNPEFLETLSDIPIASPDALADPDAFAENPIGTGPYVLDEFVPEVSVSFVRNPDYRDPEAYDFDTVTYIAYADRVAAFNALKSGQVNVAFLDPTMTGEAESQGFTVHTAGGLFATLIIMDFDGSTIPALGDIRVRQAMNMAVDRQGILDSIDLGFGRVSSQVATVGQGHYVEGGDDYYSYDLDQAKALMADAGYADGFDLVIPIVDGDRIWAGEYQAVVQQSLADIGIRVTYETFADTGTAFGAIGAGTFPVSLITPAYRNIPQVLYDPMLFPGFLDDPTFTELIDLANNGTIEEADAALADLGEYMLEESWFVVVANPHLPWGSDPGISMSFYPFSDEAKLRLITSTE